jgi:hypothetical protein
VQASTYLLNVSFNYAHWVFAFNYWALSLKLKLLTLNKPADTYSHPVRMVNYSVTAYTFLVPLIALILKLVKMSLASQIMFYCSDFSLVICCAFLTDGLIRMVRCMRDNHLVNINYLVSHILSYLLVIVTAVLSDIPFKKPSTRFAMLEAFLVSGLVS